MGAVYEAVHVELGKKVAIKALLPQLSANSEIRERMIREGKAAAKLRHPNIVDIFDVGTEEGVTYLVMELLEGEDLSARLKRTGALTAEQAVDLLVPVLSGLGIAHQHGVLHRDIKPANLVITRGPYGEEILKLVDFGIAKTSAVDTERDLTHTGAIMGTPQYMSPEQVGAERHLDGRADQYSMGVILYQALAGQTPFTRSDSLYSIMSDVVHGRYKPLHQQAPHIPPDLCSVVEKAMATSPEDRFESAMHLGAALLPYASERVRLQLGPAFAEPQMELAQVPEAAWVAPTGSTHHGPSRVMWPPATHRTRQLLAVGAAALLGAVGLWYGVQTEASSLEAPAPPTSAQALETAPPAESEPAQGGTHQPSRRNADAVEKTVNIRGRRSPPDAAPGPRVPAPSAPAGSASSNVQPGTSKTRVEDPRSEASRERTHAEAPPKSTDPPGRPEVELGTNDAPILQ